VIALRILVPAALICAVCLVLNTLDSHPRRDLIGSPVACTNSFPFRGMQAEILEYGLQDVRGLTCDASGQNVFVSEGKRSLLVYSTRSGSIIKSRRLECPGAPCDVSDRRGLAFAQPALYVAEHGRGQIMFRDFGPSSAEGSSTSDPDTRLGISKPVPGTPGIVVSPSGLAVAEQTLFITDDGQVDSWGRSSGALWVCSSVDCKPDKIVDHLEHPSGVAAAAKLGPVYVVERTEQQVRWPIFTKTADGKWIRTGALGSAPNSTGSSAFLGIAVDDSRSTIFTAGPGGVYIFGRNGRNSGRMMFDDPVTGVASCGKDVYFAVGHMLCRLKIP
jgi:hypothetical protein